MKKLLIFLVLLIPLSVECLEIAKPEEISYENENIYNKERELILREDANIYSSPKDEKVVSKVKTGDKFVFKYLINNRVYVNNGKVAGWIDLKNKDYLVESLDDYLIVKKMKLACATIPANTVIERPFVKDMDETKVIVEYKGCTEIVSALDNDSIVAMSIYNYSNYILLKKEYKMYEEANTNSNIIDTVPKSAIIRKVTEVYNLKKEGNDLVRSLPKDEVKLYVEYKGKNGWLIIKPNHYQEFEEEKDAIKYRKNSAIIKIIIDALLIIVLVAILIVRSKKRNEKNS